MFTYPEQQIIILEGHDKAGKTTLGKALSDHLHIPYFKNQREKCAVTKGDTRQVTKYVGPFLVDFLTQTGASAIIDRCYPSEFAYGGALGRKVDLGLLRQLDEWYAEIGTTIVICSKESPSEEDDIISLENVPEILQWYEIFAHWTRCRCIWLDTSSGRTNDELAELIPLLHKGHLEAVPSCSCIRRHSGLEESREAATA